MRKQPYVYRCPWCGEKATMPSRRYFTVRSCRSCEHQYAFDRNAVIYVWETLSALIYGVCVYAALE